VAKQLQLSFSMADIAAQGTALVFDGCDSQIHPTHQSASMPNTAQICKPLSNIHTWCPEYRHACDSRFWDDSSLSPVERHFAAGPDGIQIMVRHDKTNCGNSTTKFTQRSVLQEKFESLTSQVYTWPLQKGAIADKSDFSCTCRIPISNFQLQLLPNNRFAQPKASPIAVARTTNRVAAFHTDTAKISTVVKQCAAPATAKCDTISQRITSDAHVASSAEMNGTVDRTWRGYIVPRIVITDYEPYADTTCADYGPVNEMKDAFRGGLSGKEVRLWGYWLPGGRIASTTHSDEDDAGAFGADEDTQGSYRGELYDSDSEAGDELDGRGQNEQTTEECDSDGDYCSQDESDIEGSDTESELDWGYNDCGVDIVFG
jgi:hypothetical protein